MVIRIWMETYYGIMRLEDVLLLKIFEIFMFIFSLIVLIFLPRQMDQCGFAQHQIEEKETKLRLRSRYLAGVFAYLWQSYQDTVLVCYDGQYQGPVQCQCKCQLATELTQWNCLSWAISMDITVKAFIVASVILALWPFLQNSLHIQNDKMNLYQELNNS